MTTEALLPNPAVVQEIDVLIRYNTRQDNSHPAAWRVLTPDTNSDGFSERFADNVVFEVPSRTSEDLIAPGLTKWHLRARGYVTWIGDVCHVCREPASA